MSEFSENEEPIPDDVINAKFAAMTEGLIFGPETVVSPLDTANDNLKAFASNLIAVPNDSEIDNTLTNRSEAIARALADAIKVINGKLKAHATENRTFEPETGVGPLKDTSNDLNNFASELLETSNNPETIATLNERIEALAQTLADTIDVINGRLKTQDDKHNGLLTLEARALHDNCMLYIAELIAAEDKARVAAYTPNMSADDDLRYVSAAGIEEGIIRFYDRSNSYDQARDDVIQMFKAHIKEYFEEYLIGLKKQDSQQSFSDLIAKFEVDTGEGKLEYSESIDRFVKAQEQLSIYALRHSEALTPAISDADEKVLRELTKPVGYALKDIIYILDRDPSETSDYASITQLYREAIANLQEVLDPLTIPSQRSAYKQTREQLRTKIESRYNENQASKVEAAHLIGQDLLNELAKIFANTVNNRA